MVRFARDEAARLKPLPDCGPFLAARELSRRVGPDCAARFFEAVLHGPRWGRCPYTVVFGPVNTKC